MHQSCNLQFLGQSGIRFDFKGVVLYTDPYLTDSVAEAEGHHLSRLTPPPIQPHQVRDASYVFVSHDHLDHCDPETLLPLSDSSPNAKFLGPSPVLKILEDIGIDAARLMHLDEDWHELGRDLRVHPVPAAHPQLIHDSRGLPIQLGLVLKWGDKTYYFAGDTSVSSAVVDAVRSLGPISVAFLPVNEPNYYREREGIIGNMSIRDAFGFAEEIDAAILIPIHWDLFKPNRAFREEIELLFERIRPSFDLEFHPTSL